MSQKKGVKGELSVKKEEPQMDRQLNNIDKGEDTCSQWDDCMNIHVGRDRISSIEFHLPDDTVVRAGISLHSSYGSHFIAVVNKSCEYLKKLSLKHNDKLLGINYNAVECFEHDTILEMLRYLFHEPRANSIVLIVEREAENGKMEMFEIEVNEKGEPIQYICRMFTLNLTESGISPKKCRIQLAMKSNYYVTSDENKRLHLETLNKDNAREGQFDYTEYQCRSNRRGRMPVLLFYGSFESVLYPGLYITAHKNLELSLYRADPHFEYKDSCPRDPRFFILIKTSNGSSCFESMPYRGRYWICEGRLKQLRLKRIRRNRLDHTAEAKFNFIPGPKGDL